MKFLPINDAAPKVSALPRLAQVFSATSLGLGLTSSLLALAQPVQKSVQHVSSAPVQHPENQVIVGLFTALNYVAGIAILAAVIFCGIWLYQRRGDDTDVVADAQVTSPSEAEAASESAAGKSADVSDKASDEKTAADEKNAEVKEQAAAEEESDKSASEESEEVQAEGEKAENTSASDAAADQSKSDEAAPAGEGESTAAEKGSAADGEPQGQKGPSSGSKKAKNKGTKKSK